MVESTPKGDAISIFCRILHYWSYANTIETAVLLVILYDVIWHRWNAIREIRRDKEEEARRILREEDLENRQIRREHQEFIRKHWQELQSNLLFLLRIATYLKKQKQFIEKNGSSQDPTITAAVAMTVNKLQEVVLEFDHSWARVVAQLNVFPSPRDLLALEVLAIIEELGETVEDKKNEVKDETLLALAKLVKRVAEAATLPSVQ